MDIWKVSERAILPIQRIVRVSPESRFVSCVSWHRATPRIHCADDVEVCGKPHLARLLVVTAKTYLGIAIFKKREAFPKYLAEISTILQLITS